VLDLHNNELTHLPNEIFELKALQVLHLQNNKLKALPSSIGHLQRLQILNLRGETAAFKVFPVDNSLFLRQQTEAHSRDFITTAETSHPGHLREPPH
jgi:hypothetical protein